MNEKAGPIRKTDMSPEAIDARLRTLSQLFRLGREIAKARRKDTADKRKP